MTTSHVDTLVIRDLAAENAQLRAELDAAVTLVMQTMTVAVAMASLRKAEAVTMQEKIRSLQHELWTRPGPDSRTLAEELAMRHAARDAAEAAKVEEDAEAAEAAAKDSSC